MQVQHFGIQLEMKESTFSVSALWRRVPVTSGAHAAAPVVHIRYLVHPRSSVRFAASCGACVAPL